MKAIGILLIVFGLFAGAGAASMNMNNEAKNQPQAERLGEAIGGALCSLTLVVTGAILAWMSDRKPPGDGYRRPEAKQDDDPRVKNPWDTGPG
jgi:hypothetical protein